MNSERQNRINHLKLAAFRKHWKRHANFGGLVRCHVRVYYRRLERRVDADVQIYPDGRVMIMDADWFNSFDHYSEFSPDFQKYTLGKRRRGLRIHGGSNKPPENKMGEPYLYDIRPIRKKDGLRRKGQ